MTDPLEDLLKERVLEAMQKEKDQELKPNGGCSPVIPLKITDVGTFKPFLDKYYPFKSFELASSYEPPAKVDMVSLIERWDVERVLQRQNIKRFIIDCSEDLSDFDILAGRRFFGTYLINSKSGVLKKVSENNPLSWSIDGKAIVYGTSYWNSPRGSSYKLLGVSASLDGEVDAFWESTDVFSSSLDQLLFSPDGKKVVKLIKENSSPAGRYVISVSNADNSSCCSIGEGYEYLSGLRWQNNERFGFVAKSGETLNMFGYDVSTGKLTDLGVGEYPNFTSLGLVYVKDNEIILRGDKEERKLALGRYPLSSPAGDAIAYSPLDGGIAVMKSDGSAVVRIAGGVVEQRNWLWSADSKNLAYCMPTAQGKYQTGVLDTQNANHVLIDTDIALHIKGWRPEHGGG